VKSALNIHGMNKISISEAQDIFSLSSFNKTLIDNLAPGYAFLSCILSKQRKQLHKQKGGEGNKLKT
jgi:hypothetical protein